jgi:hypothetical protein
MSLHTAHGIGKDPIGAKDHSDHINRIPDVRWSPIDGIPMRITRRLLP